MAMSADYSSNHHSPPSSGTGGETAVNSPRIRKNLPSPWAQVVRGETEVSLTSDQPPSPMRQSSPQLVTEIPSSPRSADDGLHAAREGSGRNYGNAAYSPSKKPASAWNKQPSMVEALPVMEDAISWPALSEAIRFSPKVQPAADPSASAPNFQAKSAIVDSPKKSVPATDYVSPRLSQNHTASTRQKPTKNAGNGSNSADNNSSSCGSDIDIGVQNSFSNSLPRVGPPPPPPFPILVGPNSYGNFMPPMIDPSIIQPYKGNAWEGRPGFMHQPNAMSVHSNSSRRENFRSRPAHGGRHVHDRGNYRGNKDVNTSTQRTGHRGGGFVRTPPPNVVPFFPPHGVRPFGPRPFLEFYYPALHMEPYMPGRPFFPSATPVPMHIPLVEDLNLPILNQINYYFSDDNLVKDHHLKLHMDAEGWVHIGLIASFPRVKRLTTDEELILQTMNSSNIVEVQGRKLRRRNDWKKWLLRDSLPSIRSTHSVLASSLQKMTMEEVSLSEPNTESENI